MSERKPHDAWVRYESLGNARWKLMVSPFDAFATVFEANEREPIQWRIEGVPELHDAETVEAAFEAAEDALAARLIEILTKLGRLPCTSCNGLGVIDGEPVYDADGSQCGGARGCEACQGQGR